jgi:hypothetical protein
MQKVEGSNPFRRFFANRLQIGTLQFAEIGEIRLNRPLFLPPFWARVPETTQIWVA